LTDSKTCFLSDLSRLLSSSRFSSCLITWHGWGHNDHFTINCDVSSTKVNKPARGGKKQW